MTVLVLLAVTAIIVVVVRPHKKQNYILSCKLNTRFIWLYLNFIIIIFFVIASEFECSRDPPVSSMCHMMYIVYCSYSL